MKREGTWQHNVGSAMFRGDHSEPECPLRATNVASSRIFGSSCFGVLFFPASHVGFLYVSTQF